MKSYLFSPKEKPPTGWMGGSRHDWERGTDPWHRDSFPEEFKEYAPSRQNKSIEGWLALDWCGNVITFVPDGTIFHNLAF